MKIIKIHTRGWAGVDDILIIHPPAPLFELYSEKNAQGKTSFMEALLALAGGKARLVDSGSTVREGRKEAVSEVEWEHDGDTFRATIKVKSNGNMSLTLKDGDDKPVGKVRQALGALFGEMYNPTEFRTWTTAKQLEVARALAGEEWCGKADALDAEVATAEEQRRDAKRDLKKMGASPLPEKVKRVDVAAVQVQMQEARAFNEKQQARREVLAEADRARRDAARRVAELKELLKTAEAKSAEADAAFDSLDVPEPLTDTAALEQQLADASAINEQAGAYERAVTRQREIAGQGAKVEQAEVAVERARTARDDHAQTITLPDGLNMTPEGLTWQERPLVRASTGEGARVCARIFLATGGLLAIMDNAEALDNDAVAVIAEEFEKAGAMGILATRGAPHLDGALELVNGKIVEEGF